MGIMMIMVMIMMILCIRVAHGEYTFSGSDFSLSPKSAYCYYYFSNNPSFNNINTFMNATSNNIYGYASVWTSPTQNITSDSVQLGSCKPKDGADSTCSTTTGNTFNYISYDPQYILVCLECHYYLGNCIFEAFNGATTELTDNSYVSCSSCK